MASILKMWDISVMQGCLIHEFIKTFLGSIALKIEYVALCMN